MKLRKYQEEAVKFLKANAHAGLYMDMGLGKTACVVHAMESMPKPILLVGPIPVIETVWRQEAEAWGILIDMALVRGTPSYRKKVLAEKHDVYLINPETLIEVLDSRKTFGTLIIDESSMFKSHKTKRFKRLRREVKNFKSRYLLTGTPSPNSLLDLWSQQFILDEGKSLDTSFFRFRDRFFQQTDFMGYKFKPIEGAKDRILKSIAPYIYRVEQTGSDLTQGITLNPLKLQLGTKALKEYKSMEKQQLTKLLGEEITSINAAATLNKLRQMASGFVYNEEGKALRFHDEKIKALKRVVDETGSPIVVIYFFKEELEMLKEAFPEGKKFQSELIGDWNKGEIPLLFLHPQSAGHGINLQHGGHTIVVYSGSFSQEYMAQALRRVERSGQKHHVMLHWLVVQETVDELLLDVYKEKTSNQEKVLEAIRLYGANKLRDRS